MTGKLTTKRYKYATVFVDQASRLGYVYLQKTATAEETLLAKDAFERYAKDNGVEVRAYHADNGIFKAHAWVNNCNHKQQRLTFAGVNAHHQNGIAERRIRELQELARTMLIHAAKRWPAAITANLWPYALRAANDALNEVPNPKHFTKLAPLNLFSRNKVSTNAKHWKPFGCPVYVLGSELQEGKPHHKWRERSRVGIHLGRSPQHNKNVALVMNRTNGLVSPQFHVTFDATFNTVKQDNHDSTWQIKAGFAQANTSTTQAQRESKASTEMPINQRESEISRKRKLQNKAPHTSEKEIAEQIGQVTVKRVAMDKGQERPQLQQQQ